MSSHTYDDTHEQQYAEEQFLRDEAWKDRNQWCRCSEPCKARRYLRLYQCAKCECFIPPTGR